jgi:hypothetical protein
MLTIELVQINKAGNTSFKASKKLDSKDVLDASQDIAKFCKGIIKLQEANEKCGYRSAVNGIKKSLPMGIVIKHGETNIELYYKSFGKFVREATQKNIETFLKNNIKFVSSNEYTLG